MWIKTKLQGLKVSLLGFVQPKPIKAGPKSLGLKFKLCFLNKRLLRKTIEAAQQPFLLPYQSWFIRELRPFFLFPNTAQHTKKLVCFILSMKVV